MIERYKAKSCNRRVEEGDDLERIHLDNITRRLGVMGPSWGWNTRRMGDVVCSFCEEEGGREYHGCNFGILLTYYIILSIFTLFPFAKFISPFEYWILNPNTCRRWLSKRLLFAEIYHRLDYVWEEVKHIVVVNDRAALVSHRGSS